MFTILSYDKDLSILKLNGTIGKYETLISTGKMRYLILELLMLFVTPQHIFYSSDKFVLFANTQYIYLRG